MRHMSCFTFLQGLCMPWYMVRAEKSSFDFCLYPIYHGIHVRAEKSSFDFWLDPIFGGIFL